MSKLGSLRGFSIKKKIKIKNYFWLQKIINIIRYLVFSTLGQKKCVRGQGEVRWGQGEVRQGSRKMHTFFPFLAEYHTFIWALNKLKYEQNIFTGG